MAWWGRGKRSGSDPEFDFFTKEQGQRLRDLAQRAFAAAGVDTVSHAQHLQAADGRQFGLSNLAAACHNAPEGEASWPEVVDRHVTSVLAAMGRGPVADMPLDEVLARVYPRVMGTATMPPRWTETYGYAHRLGGDLVEVLALDLPETVSLLSEEDVRRLGEDTLRAAARRNLRAEAVESYEVIGDAQTAAIHVVEGESFFTASKLLVLPDLLGDTLGERELPDGLVLSVPTRHQLVFHPILDLTVVDAVQKMAGLTASIYHDGIGSVSPHVYWWNEHLLTQLTSMSDDGRLHVMAGGEFTAVLNGLAKRAG